jgi:hypothetical protein
LVIAPASLGSSIIRLLGRGASERRLTLGAGRRVRLQGGLRRGIRNYAVILYCVIFWHRVRRVCSNHARS